MCSSDLLYVSQSRYYDYKNAYLHYKVHKTLNDSLFNESNIKKIANLESAYKYEKEKQALEAEKKKKDIAIKNNELSS